MNVVSCSVVDLRNSGAVSAMKSVQNCPASSSPASGDGGARSTSRSSKPSAASLPAHDASDANTTRWPRLSSRSPSPMHWLVGP